MAKTPKMDVFQVAQGLRERGMKAQVFANGIHWRIEGQGVDLWPTTGRWKWLTTKHQGTVGDFMAFLDSLPARRAVMADVIVTRR